MLKLYKLFHWFKWKLRLYLFWSMIYRFLSRSWRYDLSIYGLPSYTPETAQKMMNLIEWKKDKWHSLWDALGSPYRFQHYLNINCNLIFVSKIGKQPPCCNDCDEFAYWATCVVKGSLFLSVAWMDISNNKYDGHNVCLLYKMEGKNIYFYHIGNWGHSKYFSTIGSLIEDIIGKENKMIGWAVMNKERNVLDQSRKYFPENNEIMKLFFQ